MANSTATILVNLRDNASQGVQGIRQQVEDLGQKGVGAFEGLKTSAGGALSGITGMLNPATLAAGAVAGIGAAALGVAANTLNLQNEFSTSLNKMQAQLGLTEEQTTQYGETAKQVFGNNFGATMTEATEAVGTVAKSLKGLDGEELKGATENALRLKDAYGVDVSESVAAAKTLTEKFGISSQEAFDFIAKGMQDGLNQSGDFLDSIGEYGTQFSNGGASAAEFYSVMKTGLGESALGTDKAADLFKEFSLRITDGSKASGDSLKALGINSEEVARKIGSGEMSKMQAFELVQQKLTKVKDTTERQNLAIGLMGTQYEDLGQKAVQAISSTAVKTSDLAGSTAKLDAQYDNFGDMIQGEWRKVQVGLMPIGEALFKLAQTIMPLVREAFTTIVGFVTPFIVKLAEVGNKGTSSLESIRPALNSLGELFKTVFALISTLWTNVLKPAFSAMEPYIRGVFAAIGPILRGFFGLLKGIVGAITALLKGDFQGAFSSLKTGVISALNGLSSGIESVFNGILATFRGIATKVVGLGANIVDGLVRGIESKIAGAIQKVKDFGSNILKGIRSVLDIRSPSRKMAEVGKFFVEGFIKGMLGEAPKAEATAEELAEKTKEAMEKFSGKAAKFQKSLELVSIIADTAGVNKDLVNLIDTLASNVGNVVTAVGQFASGDIIGGIVTSVKVIASVGQALVKLVVGQNAEIAKSYAALAASIKDSAARGEIALTKNVSNLTGKLEANAKRIGNFWDNLFNKGMVEGLKAQSAEIEAMLSKYSEIAKGIFGNAASSLKSALKDYLSGKTDLAGLKEAFKKNVYEGVLSGIIDALVNKVVIEGALGGLLAQISEALATGNIDEANRLLRQVGSSAGALVDSLDLSGLREAFSPVLGAGETSSSSSSSASLGSLGGMSNTALSIPLFDAAKSFGGHVDRFGGYVDRLVDEGIKVVTSLDVKGASQGYLPAY